MRAEPFQYWAPAVAWAALILSLSGEGGSARTTAGWITWLFGEVGPETLFYINYSLRKGAHVVGYGVLGWLNLRAIRGPRQGRQLGWSVAAVLLAGLVALADELHQSTSAARTAALADIGFDLCGAALAVTLAGRQSAKRYSAVAE